MAQETVPQSALPVKSYAEANRELTAAFDRYLESRGLKVSTRNSYGRALQGFTEFLGSASVGEADRDTIRRFLGALYERGLHENTMRLRTAALRAFFKFVRMTGLTKHDPMLMLSHRKLPVRLPKVLSTAIIDRLLVAAKTPLETAVVEWFYATGVRVSELVSMRLEDVDFETNVARVVKGKGGKSRIVLFGSKAAEALRAMLAWRPNTSGYLFERPAHGGSLLLTSQRGQENKQWIGCYYDAQAVQRKVYLGLNTSIYCVKTLTREEAKEKFDALLKDIPGVKQRPAGAYTDRAIRLMIAHMGNRAGMGSVHPHALRRAVATHMLEHGADLRAIQDLLGHDRISTTAIYTTLSAANLKAVHERCHPRGGDNEKQ